jgi:imidazolonepropionase-like amidohydrolase
MADLLLIRNARLFDSLKGRLQPNSQIVIDGATIADVTTEAVPGERMTRTIDAGGRVVLPGLIDAHVHVTAVSHDLAGQAMQPVSLVAAQSGAVLSDMLRRGFTTVRDAGGADAGLQEAVERGLFEGPRLFVAGFPISQTGGHADLRPRGHRGPPMYCSCAGFGLLGAIADGVGEVRRAVREQVRTGANHIKIMAGGGIASPSDPLEGTQFSMEELRAACEEAEAANLYALAHAYSPRAVTRAVEAGVRSIEHGNLIDVATAKAMKAAGTFLVPTLATYAALGAEGERLGWSASMLDKLRAVQERGIDAVRIAHAEGVPIVFGTDLLGHMHARQNREFMLRAPAMSPVEVLQSATSVAARLLRQEGRVGVIARGAWADLLIVDGDPTQDPALLAAPGQTLRMIVKAGRIVEDKDGLARYGA